MKFGIIIPVHNEADCIALTLDSLLKQSLKPHKIVVVDDNSTDDTSNILSTYVELYPDLIKKVYRNSSAVRLPGAKVIQAFNEGIPLLDDVDVICKFDADLIFPINYLQTLENHYQNNPQLGMCGGFCSIEQQGRWIIENLTNKNHLRGALKSYRKACFEAIGGLKTAMGWDTLDELLARYYNWQIKTDPNLIVKHLRPTGKEYNSQAQYLQGQMFYRLGYGFWITLLASGKLAYRKRKFSLFKEYLLGYFKAKKEKQSLLVTPSQARWIRNYRWRGILGVVLGK